MDREDNLSKKLSKYVKILLCLTIVWDCVCTFSGIYYDNGQQTMLENHLDSKERKEVQHEILHLLGLNRKPHPILHDTINSAPKFLMDLYENFEDDDVGDVHVNRRIKHNWFNISSADVDAIDSSDFIMTFVNHGHHIGDAIRHHKDQMFWFDLSEVPLSKNLIAAELRIYKQESETGAAATINLHKVKEGRGKSEKRLELIATLNTTQSDEGWMRVNVTDLMVYWLIHPDSNRGLYMTVDIPGAGMEVHPSDIGLVGSKGPEHQQPFLAAFFDENVNLNQRKRRSSRRKSRRESHYTDNTWNPYADYDTRGHRRRTCQKRTLYVSFRDLGWQDWIIAPDGYAAFYCYGECSFPLNAHMNATNHAIVQTLVHLMNPYIVPKPCCAPTKLSPISVLYFDNNSNVILKKYKNMVVKSCGCH